MNTPSSDTLLIREKVDQAVAIPVSYTHLDVYKRQRLGRARGNEQDHCQRRQNGPLESRKLVHADSLEKTVW